VCFGASSVIPDWFQTGVFCGFWKGNTPCPPFALVLLLHSLYPFNWWISPKRLTNTLQPATPGEKRGQKRRKEKKTKEEQTRDLNAAEHCVIKTCSQPLLCCSTLLYSILFSLWHTAYCPFSLPHSNRGSIPQATDHFKTAFIVARCFFWLQEGLTLPYHSIAKHILLPTVVWAHVCVCVCVCVSLPKYICVCKYVFLHTTWELFVFHC